MRDNDLRDDAERAFPFGEPPRIVELRYWSAEDMARLVRLAGAQATTRQIAIELGRSQLAVRLKASRMGLSLTAHEVRRSAKRHAKREGSAPMADLKSLRKRPRIVMTVDFDLSALTRLERRQLAERLREMEAEESGAAPGDAPPAVADAPAERRPLRIPAPYDPSIATTKRQSASSAARAANRKSLGWKRSTPPERDVDIRDPALDPLERLVLKSMLDDPEVRARVEAMEDEEDAKEVPLYIPPPEDQMDRIRRYLRER